MDTALSSRPEDGNGFSLPQDLPLSPGQQTLWYMQQLAPGNSMYVRAHAVRIHAPVDAVALRQTFQRMLERHPLLCATFPMTPEGVVLRFLAPGPEALDFQIHEAVGWDAATVDAAVAAASRESFDLATGPLFRVRLWNLGPEEHVLLHTIHHIIADDGSLAGFWDELEWIYSAVQNGAVTLTPLDFRYVDYVRWQQAFLKGSAAAPLWEYWETQLAGELPDVTFPLDRPRPLSPDYEGGVVFSLWGAELSAAVRQLSARLELPLQVVLLAVFEVLVYRYTGQSDLILGTMAAERQSDWERFLGYFGNPLVLREQLSDRMTFAELARQVDRTLTGAYEHRQVPFPLLVERLQSDRQARQAPFFHLMFLFEESMLMNGNLNAAAAHKAVGSLKLSGWEGETIALPPSPAQFDFILTIITIGSELGFSLQYAMELFDRETIERLAIHWQNLTAALVADPEQPIGLCEYLSPAERRQLLENWNATATAYPRERCVADLFEEEAARRPEAIAVELDGQTLTYGELNARANQLAHYLQRNGVGAETRVGVSLTRSFELIVGLVGIVKAGGAYVPLDVRQPADRLLWILDDTKAAMLLTQVSLVGNFTDYAGPRLLLDVEWERVAGEPVANPARQITPDHLIYVMYTSGSTGQPKGVGVVHRGVVRLVKNADYARLDEGETWLQFASISFDPATLEIWGPLLNGGRLVLAPPDMLMMEDLGRLIRESGVTSLQLTSGVFPLLVDQQMDDLVNLHQLITGGDVLSVVLAKKAAATLSARIINAYGPTENTMITTCYAIPDNPSWTEAVPIGGAISNSQIYVLDNNLLPVPVGVVGELYTGGDGLARGYWRRPGLTAEKFIPHPFSPEPGARLYATGDLCRYLPDGNLEFLGRRDQQYKVRGFRIELGEIETQLNSYPGVRESVVLVRRNEIGEKALVAYIVDSRQQTVDSEDWKIESLEDWGNFSPSLSGNLSHLQGKKKAIFSRAVCGARKNKQKKPFLTIPRVVSREENSACGTLSVQRLKLCDLPSSSGMGDTRTSSIQTSSLQAYLKERLPEYMMPSAYVFLEALPLTATGKVDRKALPAPVEYITSAAEFVPPRTLTEAALGDIWISILHLERVGIHDSFFELGGHSLLATQVISRLRSLFNVEYPLYRLIEQPTIAEMAAYVDELLLAEGLEAGDLSPIRPVDRKGPLPLSFAQQRLWFLDQLDPGRSTYNEFWALQLIGPLDLAAVEQSLNILVARHEIFRTTFSVVDGEPRQKVAPVLDFSLPRVDLSALPTEDREAEARQLLTAEVRRPFDLSRGPLIRGELLRLDETEHWLLLTFHHIIIDGWSLGVLENEFAVLYTACHNHTYRPEVLPILPIQYADFAVWQRSRLQGADWERQLDYWKKQLAAPPPMLELPGDYVRPTSPSYQGSSVEFILPPELVEALQTLSRQQGVTLFMTFLAAFQILLYRYTGQTDIAVGSPIANRNRKEIEGLIGFFVNTLVMRTTVSEGLTFRGLLERVREMTMGAYAHQDLPFDRLVEVLHPERGAGATPFFNTMFVLQNAPVAPLELPDLRLLPLRLPSQTAKFDLVLLLEFRDGEAGLSAVWEYLTDLFARERIERMAGHFRALLEGVVAQPDLPLAQLPLLTAEEQRLMLEQWNATATTYPRERCVSELFEEQAARRPDAVAVTFGDQSLTYRELNARANQLAHYLRRAGVGPETPVGLSMTRSMELIVGVLGIVKSGGIYVPLDVRQPEERLLWVLNDTEAPILLTQQALAESFTAYSGQRLLLDTEWDQLAAESPENPAPVGMPENLLYIIYTSGSTGVPKGVGVPHRGLVRLVKNNNYVEMNEAESWLQFTSISFDPSAWEIWGALLNGGRLVVAPPGVLSLEELGRVIRESGVTSMIMISGLFPLMVDQQLSDLINLRYLIVGGDVLSLPHARKVAEMLPGRLVNAYGPTENSVVTTCYPVSNAQSWTTSVPIGSAIYNTEIYVLDDRMQPVPVGVPGELYTGGEGLARGYWRRPALTAEKFVPHPFSKEPGARLYRTGDLCRFFPDGNLEFLGRLDQQVKIRGFRIELGDIEAQLLKYPGVKNVLVTVLGSGAHEKRLVAYIVDSRQQTVDSEEGNGRLEEPGSGRLEEWKNGSLDAGARVSDSQSSNIQSTAFRSFLKDYLPDYMIPAAFVVLDELPLTPTGKVDRNALPVPEPGFSLRTEYVAPRTPTEAGVQEIWSAVLSVPQPGIHDNFFEMGGHSLLATQVVSRIRALFNVELPLRRLLEHPTIAGVAADVDALLLLRGSGGAGKFSPIQPVKRGGLLPLSFAQQRLWFLDQLDPGLPTYNIPLALRLVGPLDRGAVERSLNALVERHETLRTAFVVEASEPRQEISPVVRLAVPVADLRVLSEAEREREAWRLTTEEALLPFDLSRGPLVRARLLQLGEREHWLLLTLHHIISDGWSMGVLSREFNALYTAFCENQSLNVEMPGDAEVQKDKAGLPPLPIQYADFTLWQQEQMQQGVWESQLEYWKQQLGTPPPPLELPTDYPRPTSPSERGANLEFILPVSLVDALQNLSQQQGVTLFMILLAAFKTLLFRYTGQTDLSVGSPIANRNRSEIEGLIGFFVNTLALRTQLTEPMTFTELLERVRETTLEAYAHQDLPFEKMVEVLQPERDFSHTPFFNVMLVLQNSPVISVELPELAISQLRVPSHTAKFDLLLSLEPEENGRGLLGTWEYRTDLFVAERIERMVGHFRTLLEGIVAQPTARLTELPLLTAAERQQLDSWARPEKVQSPMECLHQLFEAQCERTPEAPAVRCGDEQLTYRELNARANQLAHRLRRAGVGPDQAVGLVATRSIEALVGVLGIVKAGGAYLPLDPGYPPERLAFMGEDARLSVVVMQKSLEPLAFTAQRVYLEEIGEEAETGNLPNLASPESLLYVLYTSGSTGRPKGVALPHRVLTHLIRWQLENTALSRPARTLHYASLNFDVSCQELFTAWCSGGTVIVAKNEQRQDFTALLNLLAGEAVERIFLPFVALQYLTVAASLHSQRPALALREVITAGEALQVTGAVKDFFAALPGATLHNQYGPTETHVATAFTLNGAPDSWETWPPVGRPVTNAECYVLDPWLRPVPVGVPGELYLGGSCLARGYRGRPALTAEKFIPHPFSDQPGARLYRTGDLCRWRSDGEIEFLGRRDAQIKIRGFRVELGEIEAVLQQYPGVVACVVVVREETPGDKRLVAYIVDSEERKIGRLEEGDVASGFQSSNIQSSNIQSSDIQSLLREHLKTRLPEYMVPSAFVMLPELPRTPSGKIDRRSLPKPEVEAVPETDELAIDLPQTALEKKLVDIWMGLFQQARMGIRANFFELGGHSLLAARLLLVVQSEFKVEVALRKFLERPTIEHLAMLIEEAGVQRAGPMEDAEEPDLWAEVRSMPELDPLPAGEAVPAAIFLTGATGFLGVYLLAELLRRQAAPVYCLVRAADARAGFERICKKMQEFRLWDESFRERIVAVAGSLAQPRFGLDEVRFQELAGAVGSIFHCGAGVSYAYSYAGLKPANVLGTQTVLELAALRVPKAIHYISTLGVFSDEHYQEEAPILESDPAAECKGLHIGYGQSKWVAEQLMLRAKRRGFAVSIYRPGRISGHTQTGLPNQSDFIYRMIFNCAQMGAAPEMDYWVDQTPVDFVSAAVWVLSRRPDSPESFYHLTNPRPMLFRRIVEWFATQGRPLQLVSYGEWLVRLQKHLEEQGRPEEYYALAPVWSDGRPAKNLVYDIRNVTAGLAGTGIECPPVDERLLARYFGELL